MYAAVKEVIEKVLAEPIRPHFVVANIGSGFRLYDIFRLISRKLGSSVPFIISTSSGIIGRDALTHEVKEVKWGDVCGDGSDEDCSIPAKDVNYGILLTVGFVPGLKVDAIPLLRSTKNLSSSFCSNGFVDTNVYNDIRNLERSCLINSSRILKITQPLFQDGLINMKPIIDALDYSMPMETVIVGDERGRFLYRSGNESRNVCGSAKYFSDAVALIFARDKDKPSGIGDIQFQIALSKGVSTVGSRHKAVSVKENHCEHSTWLTARREGHPETLDGQQLLNDINDELEDYADSSDLYIGVIKRRNISMGSEKPRMITSLEFHGVVGGDDEYLYVSGVGIKTADYFHFYRSDPESALSSCNNVSLSLKKLKSDEDSKHRRHISEVFGGFMFACCGRGESFFGHVNVDGSPFVENFPGVPLAGIFCGGEIGRGPSRLTGEAHKDSDARCNMHDRV
ncbi:hypothetical protein Prudu_014589 [Prunus dulcis]|uniref:FIST C-domain domain-containing protein n=1 Tax=Prunus dulcis TaxID=3755 RepID=A0A4Y1RIF5_PRUDU|nr:hypothetical protein Prudu_014589 [Prunus dulcis]